ncbi:MAG: DNA-processing protein DprA [Patescibacteria group bacterium]
MNYRQIGNWKKLGELEKLLELRKPPEKIYYAGEWKAGIFENCAAVVGSRRMTEYGRWSVDRLVRELVDQGKTIVSGFMYGMDQAAHEAAMEHGGRTIAVLGWGMTWKLEKREQVLAEKIINSGGLILSEWENQEPTLWTFPVRNRIVAALASAVYVVEAAEKSGSMITVNEAVKLGREVWAVPGPITSQVSSGTNNLIASGTAKPWLPGKTKALVTAETPAYRLIREQGGLTADEMGRILGVGVDVLGIELTHLVLSGVVVERDGQYYQS